MGMLLWKVGVFKRPRVPQGPPGNWPAVGHWWQCWLLYMGSRPMAEFCVQACAFFCHLGGAWCSFLPFEFYSFRALKGVPSPPASRVKAVFSILFAFAASFSA